MAQPVDRNGKPVRLGARVRLVSLSGQWLNDLPDDEKPYVMSMIGEIFEVQDIDKDGRPWVSKSWPDDEEGSCFGHTIALDPHEMELIDDSAP